VKLYRGLPPKGFDLLGLSRRDVVFIREASMASASFFSRSFGIGMTPSAGLVQRRVFQQNTSQEPSWVDGRQFILVQEIQHVICR